MPRTRRAITVADWERLADSVPPELAAEVPALAYTQTKLREMHREILALFHEQDALEARRQEVTRRINELLEEGRKVATFQRSVLKEHHGDRSEKLIQHGIKPFRGRKRPARPKDSADIEEAPPSGGLPT
jgi:hypothetical protein